MTGDAAVLAIVIGRAGSKGLPGKNTLPVAGQPMVGHTIDDALTARAVGRVVVSTDCPRVTAAARARGVRVIPRPDSLAGDHATVGAALAHAAEAAGGDEPIIVALYANVPVRPDDLVDRAVARLRETGADSVQSYSDVGKCHPYWMVFTDVHHRVRPFIANTVDRRQDLPPLLVPDGGVLVVRRSLLEQPRGEGPHAFLGHDRRAVVNPIGSVIDVDTAFDLQMAEAVLRHPAMGVAS